MALGTLKYNKRWTLPQNSSQYSLLKSVHLEGDLNAVSSFVSVLNMLLEKANVFLFFFFPPPFWIFIQSFQNIYNILKWVFIVFPQFCLGQGLIELSYNQIKFDLTSNFGIDSYVSPFEMNFLGWIFVEMALQGTLLLLLRLFLHWDLLQKPRCVTFLFFHSRHWTNF